VKIPQATNEASLNERQYPLNVLAIAKDGERFLFLYDDDSVEELIRVLGQYAADTELNFSWYDAALLSKRIKDRRPAD